MSVPEQQHPGLEHAIAGRGFEELASVVSAWLDRHPVIAFAAIGVLIGATTVVMAVSKPLWHDEIFTVLLASLPTRDLWTANLSGVDLSPPLNTLLTHFVISIAGSSHLAVRFAPLAGFAISVAVIFEFVRRRSNTAAALVGALLPGFTAAYRYSYEARGYGLMVGFAALALFAWAEAAAGRRRRIHVPLLATALAAGYWTHFYGLFAAVPVMAGELARTRRLRKVDAAVWSALILSLVSVIPLAPLIRAGASLAPTFWGRAGLSDLLPTYEFLLNSVVEPAFLAGTAILVIAALAQRRWRIRSLPHVLPGHERMALTVSVALPAIEIVAALATTGVFVPRYALAAVPATCIALALAMVRLTHSRVLQVAAAAALTVSFAVPATFRPAFTNPARQRPALMGLLARGQPVVVTGGLMYLQLWYYTPPAMRGRLYYLAHPNAARLRTGSDSIDQGLLGLADWTPVTVVEPRVFVRTHREFFVYTAGSGWLVEWLREDCAHIEQLGVESASSILAVRLE